ncbi:hypothetical protein ACWGTO_18435 [Mesorhizobium sp. PL10]
MIFGAVSLPRNAYANSDEEYWVKFLRDMDGILKAEHHSVVPIESFVNGASTNTSVNESRDLLNTSEYFVKSFNSGDVIVYVFANDVFIVNLNFDGRTGYFLSKGSGPWLKKTVDDYKVHPAKK